MQTTTDSESIAGVIDAFFWEIYARSAKDEEIEKMEAYYQSIDDHDTAMQNIAFALMNTKEFIYLY